MTSLLLRGMLVGVVAGLLAFAFARGFGEPQVERAIAYEQRSSAPADAMSEPEPVGRVTQAGIGLATATVAYGAAIGGLFALVFAVVYGRVGRLDARATSALLALAGFTAIVLVPQLVYPANPPAVGTDETIGTRTALFFILLALSIVATTASVLLARLLWARHGGWNASLIGGAAFLLFLLAVQVAMPAIAEVPDDFSAEVLWRFRLAAIGIHVVLWTVIGLAFGPLAAKVLGEGRAGRAIGARS